MKRWIAFILLLAVAAGAALFVAQRWTDRPDKPAVTTNADAQADKTPEFIWARSGDTLTFSPEKMRKVTLSFHCTGPGEMRLYVLGKLDPKQVVTLASGSTSSTFTVIEDYDAALGWALSGEATVNDRTIAAFSRTGDLATDGDEMSAQSDKEREAIRQFFADCA